MRWPTPRRAPGCCARCFLACAPTRSPWPTRSRCSSRGAPAARPAAAVRGARGTPAAPTLEFKQLPRDPGVYLFRDDAGATLYVGKSVSIRSRARAHFAPSSVPANWTAHATVVDYQPDQLRARRARAREPADQVAASARETSASATRRPARLHPLPPGHRVSDPRGGGQPAAGHAVDHRPPARPAPGRRAGRAARLAVRPAPLRPAAAPARTPSAYGQMGRCLSPCLGDLDPNLYRRRLDEALRLFLQADPAARLIDHVEAQMRSAAAAQRYERARWLRRRRPPPRRHPRPAGRRAGGVCTRARG